MRLYYCDQYEIPVPAGHKFPVRKYRMVREALQGDERFELVPAPLADPGLIERAHDSAYVRGFLGGSLDSSVMRRIGFPWSEGLRDRTLASVGGTLAAGETALEQGIAGTLAGGTHHAFREEGAGFCVFNDVAILVYALRPRVTKIAVLDLDVHQGDGTAAFFERDPDVLTVSLHGAHNFPFRKRRSKIDVEFADGTKDDEYLEAVDAVLPKVVDFGPQLIVYLSGVDALATDRLGRLALTSAGMLERDRRVLAAARAAGIPLAITLGGGYSEPIEYTVAAHAATFRTAVALY